MMSKKKSDLFEKFNDKNPQSFQINTSMQSFPSIGNVPNEIRNKEMDGSSFIFNRTSQNTFTPPQVN